GEDARPDTQRRVGAAVEVLGEQRLALGVADEVGDEGVEMLDRHRVVVIPQDARGALGVAHNELVLGAASRVHAGVGDKRSMRRDVGFMTLQRLLVELRRAKVPMNGGKIAKAELLRAEVDVARPILDHPERPSLSALKTVKRAPPPSYVNFAPRGQAGKARIDRERHA